MCLGMGLAFGLNWPTLLEREETGRSLDPLWIPKSPELVMMGNTKVEMKRPALMGTGSLAKEKHYIRSLTCKY